MNFKTLETEALDLSPEERARLAQTLLLSLESLSEAETEQLWMAEAARRAQEIDSGTVKLTPAEEVRRRAHTLLR